MRVTIFVNGKEFKSKLTNDINAKDAKDAIYENLEKMNKLELETENGFILLGELALKNAVILITEK